MGLTASNSCGSHFFTARRVRFRHVEAHGQPRVDGVKGPYIKGYLQLHNIFVTILRCSHNAIFRMFLNASDRKGYR